MQKNLLEVKGLEFSFYDEVGSLKVVRDFELTIKKGEIVGILGESGCGKTVSASAIIQLYDEADGVINTGEIIFKGKQLINLSEQALMKIRGPGIGYIFQNPTNTFNPYKTIGAQLRASLKVHGLPNHKQIIYDILKEVGIQDPEMVYNMYPHQLSGGQNQRIMIGRAILCKPELIIADEPTSAIDSSHQKKILDLIKNISLVHALSVIIITHDFDVAKYICDRIVVMYGGLVVEEGIVKNIMTKPQHPYTEELIKCALSLDNRDSIMYSLEGSPPNPNEYRDRCPFYERCYKRMDKCIEKLPRLLPINEGSVRCIVPMEGGL